MPNRQMKTLTIDGKTYDIVDANAHGGDGGLWLNIVFSPQIPVGTAWSVTGAAERYTGIVPEGRTVRQDVEGLMTRYTVSCGLFTAQVQTERWYGRCDVVCGTLPTWSGGTDEQIAWMVGLMDDGLLTPADTQWQVGDERTVYLSAMTADGVGEAHQAQSAVLVLMDSGHYDLWPGERAAGGRDHFVVGLKNPLSEYGYMNPTDSNAGSWHGCARRGWCNGAFRAALPEAIRGCFKKFQCITAEVFDGNTLKVSDDYFALFAEKEIFGGNWASNATEAAALTQIEYYKTEANRKKNGLWWARSPRCNSPNFFASVDTTPDYDVGFCSDAVGLAPFGCI